jgi:hypothetical protein
MANEDFAPAHSGQTTMSMICLPVSFLFCPLPRQGALVLKHPNLSFPLGLFTNLSDGLLDEFDC